MMNLLLATINTKLIVISSIVFLAIILMLVIFILIANSKLKPQGKVKLVINDDADNTVEVDRGGTLLSTLMTKDIILPSACGGGGTCAMCKCQVIEGGGDVLATEEGHLSRKEQQDNWRLACQVKVKNDMKVQVPAEIFSIKSWECTVRSNDNVATFIKELVLELPDGEIINFESGGYIQIDIPKYEIDFKDFDIAEEYHGDWNHFNMFDVKAKNNEEIFRAYSMANHPAEGNIVMLNVRIANPPPGTNFPWGKASSFIFNLKAGDKVNVSGAFGEFFIKETEAEMCYIGGGAGMAPLRSHLFHLFHTLKTGRKVNFWYGARSVREMFYDDEFKAIAKEFPNFSYNVALSDPQPEDNWEGPTGFIHQAIADNFLSKHDAPEDIEYYMCGPPMMIKCVEDMLYDLGVDKEMIAFDEF